MVLAARMTRWAVGGKRSHPFVTLSISRWAATTGQEASAVCSQVATLVRTSVRPRWSCGAGVGGFGRFTSVHRWNQTRALFRAKEEWRREKSRGFDCGGLEEGQDVVAIVCNGGQRLGGSRLGGGLLCLTWLLCLGGSRLGEGLLHLAQLFCFSSFDRHDAIIVAGLIGLA